MLLGRMAVAQPVLSQESATWEVQVDASGSSNVVSVGIFDAVQDTLILEKDIGGESEHDFVQLSFDDPGGDVEISSFLLLRIDIESIASESFLYMHCNANEPVVPAAAAFYCPNVQGGINDLQIFVGDEAWVVDPIEISNTTEEVDDILEYYSNDFVLPHDFDIYCNGPPASGCRYDNVSWFLVRSTNQDPFVFADHDVTQPSSRAWKFSGVDIALQAGNDLIIPTGLDLEDASLQADGTILLEGGSTSDWTDEVDLGTTTTVSLESTAILDLEDVSVTGGKLRIETSTTSELNFDGGSSIAFDSILVSGDVSFASGSTTTFDGTVMYIPAGDTVIIPSGATVVMDGTESNPTRFIVDGYFEAESGSSIECAGRFSEIIGEEGVDYNLFGTVNMNCPFACVMARDAATVTIGSDFSVADSGLIAIKTGGTFVINDTVTVDYTSAVKPVVQKGARIEIGDDALLRIDVDGSEAYRRRSKRHR